MSNIVIRQPDDAEYDAVRKYVDRFWLDKSYMHKGQFRILLYGGAVAAFVRLRRHASCNEMSTLGVVDKFRGRHFGMALVNGLLAELKSDLYLVTVEPDYFHKIGFRFARTIPAIMKKKLEKCRRCFAVGKPYRVMVHRWNLS